MYRVDYEIDMSSIAPAVEKTRRQLSAAGTAIYSLAVEKLIDDAQKTLGEGGRMPVITGFLRNSLLVNLHGQAVGKMSESGDGPELSLDLGEEIRIAWHAVYAEWVEFGARTLKSGEKVYKSGGGRYFLTKAVERWPQFLQEATEEVNAMIERKRAGRA